ncbi:MAG TPA: transcription antitermination factor NusB [Gaiellaceae bacterium]
MNSPARNAAFGVVRRVFEDQAYADRAMASATAGLDARDRALAQRIAYGTVQRKRTIDHGIDTIGSRPAAELDRPVLAALRIAAYELAWSDAAPHAVVNDAVELVRGAGLAHATGFTNAVARRLAERFPALVASLAPGPLAESYPDWIYHLWVRDWGPDEALALMRAQNEPAELVVRSDVPIGEPTDVPGAYRLERGALEGNEEGRIWQSRGSQLAALAVGSSDEDKVLDACAAPGAKTTMLKGHVTAVELHLGRARELSENVLRLGATNVRVVNTDLRELAESGFDRALVDAPCSGLGVLARRPDLRWRATALPGLQQELLAAAVERTRSGGTVVYSVCTLNADENEAVVDASGLEPEPLGDEWPAFAHPERPEFLLTTPHRHGTSGFFIARLRVP